MAWKFQILNLFRKPTQQGQLTNEKYIPFLDDNDNFPLQWSKTIAESPSSASCLSVLQDFLQGHGFSDSELEKKVINSKGETFFQLHQQTADCYAEFCGYYWLCRYNSLGQITELELLSFECCRLGKPDSNGYISKIFYNPFFGTPWFKGNNDEHTKIYDVFNPAGVKGQISQQKDKFKGQVYFYGATSPLSRFYPINEAYSSRKWMKIETGVSDYHEDNISNGFLQPFMLVMKGNPNEPSANPDYANVNGADKPATIGQEFDDVVSKNFMGAKRVGNMFVQWVGQGEEKPEVVEIPSNNNGDLFITVDNQATKKITIAWKVPAVLANIHEGVSLGGDGNQIRVSVKLMQQRVVKKQRTLTDNYSYILKLMAQPYTQEITITPWEPYKELEVLDDKIWEAMTLEERREWIQEKTDIDLLKDETVLQEPTIPQASYKNTVPVPFPDNVREVVKRTLDYMDKMGIKCGGKGGVDVANMILNNQNMGLKQLKRIHSYLKKREQLENSPYDDDCEVIKYKQWGGKAMFDFLDAKLKDLDAWLN